MALPPAGLEVTATAAAGWEKGQKTAISEMEQTQVRAESTGRPPGRFFETEQDRGGVGNGAKQSTTFSVG
jgi:hypothetical protein